MAHRLTPTAATPERTLPELLSLLESSFSVFKFDHQQGDLHIDQMIGQWQIILTGYSRWKSPPPQMAELRSQIERFTALRGNAAFVHVADDERDQDLAVHFNLIPNEEIIIGYANQLHETKATAVTLRVATVLGYDSSLT